jgi:dCMP deaminase
MATSRPDWDRWFLNGAEWASQRGACSRRQVGAMLIDPVTKDIIEPGYNGPPAGHPDCLSGACPRGRHYQDRVDNWAGLCHCGSVWPCPEAVEPGSSYDTGPGACIALHAEQNAIIRAGRRARGAWLYITDAPCGGCKKLIMGAGIVRVIWEEEGVMVSWEPTIR